MGFGAMILVAVVVLFFVTQREAIGRSRTYRKRMGDQ